MPGEIDLMCIQTAKGFNQVSRLLENLASVFFHRDTCTARDGAEERLNSPLNDFEPRISPFMYQTFVLSLAPSARTGVVSFVVN